MAKPKNPNAKPRKPREPKNIDPTTLLNQARAALSAAQSTLLGITSLEAAHDAIKLLTDLRKQAKDMQALAEFVGERYESEAELRRQLEAANKPAARKPAIAPQAAE